MLNILKTQVYFTVCACGLVSLLSAEVKPVEGLKATSSSVNASHVAEKAVDGVVSDGSRWIGPVDADGKAWLELRLPKRLKLGGVHLYSGFMGGDAVQDFHMEFQDTTGKWVAIPSAAVIGNAKTAVRIPFDATVEVETEVVRLIVTKTPLKMARIREVVLWPADGDVPELGAGIKKSDPSAKGGAVDLSVQVPKIYLNQSGFNLGKPKRFTAPTLPDGTPFAIHLAAGGDALFSGKIDRHVGDFTDFNPDKTGDYIVKAGDETSVPFAIGPWHLERVTYQNSINFMIDSRHYVGNYKGGCGGSFGWRDDHHFAWELHTLVPQYLSNPAAYDRMPRQVQYEPGNGRWGKLQAYKPEAPDLVKLIHWGADVIVSQGLTHEHLKAQLAYFLYAWPVLEPFLPQQNYEIVRDFAFRTWAMPGKDRNYPYDESPENNLLALKTHIGTTKGAYPPGASIQPNLLMFEVAKREKRPDADVYFKAAHEQATWMIANLNWEDPLVTKGQRMSEFLTITGLAHFLREYPDQAPKGLREKIEAWARVAVRRSDNYWDFRKLGDGDDQWAPMGAKPQMWNEVGNVLGLPSSLLAASELLEDTALKARLVQIAYAHLDNMFGRNPVGRHFSYDAPKEVEGVEHGWFIQHAGGIGQLSDARFVLEGSSKNGHYPYHPEKGNIGWTEGWIQHNTPLNLSLAYLARADTKLELKQEGKELIVRLSAPLNFDPDNAEPVTLVIEGPAGPSEVELKEEAQRSEFHVGRIELDKLGAKTGDVLKCRYGFGYMATEAKLKLR